MNPNIIKRSHMIRAWQVNHMWLDATEAAGLPFKFNPLNQREKIYSIIDLVEFLDIYKNGEYLTAGRIKTVLREAYQDVTNRVEQTGTSEALEVLMQGGIPNFENGNEARNLTAAYKNMEDAKKREVERKKASGELVNKSILRDKINKIADLYEQKFGEILFRELESKADAVKAAIENDTFYEFIRELMSPLLDENIEMINIMEAELDGK